MARADEAGTRPGVAPWLERRQRGTIRAFLATIGMAMILFFIPTRSPDAGSRTVMGVDVFKNIPWHIVLLFGGGFALAQGFRVTGLSQLIGTRFAGLEGAPPYAMITLVCAGLTFLTELIEAGKVTPVIDRVYSLREVPDAMVYLERGHARGKVVITMAETD